MESILTSVKKMLGISAEYDHFDADIIMHINSAFMVLTQMGVGPKEGFIIEDETSTWAEFMKGSTNIESVKSYVYLKVRLLFEHNTLTGPVIESINRMLSEYEWRLNVAADSQKSIYEEEIQNG